MITDPLFYVVAVVALLVLGISKGSFGGYLLLFFTGLKLTYDGVVGLL